MKSIIGTLGRWRRPIIAILALSFLMFTAGAFVTHFRVFPYNLLFAKPFEYLQAHQEQKEIEAEEEEVLEKSGRIVARVDTAATPEAYDGYTLLTFGSGKGSAAKLIDMEGNVHHEWRRPFSKIMPKPPHRDSPLPDKTIGWRYAHFFPNGDIVISIKSLGQTPDGCAMAKLDKDSNLIWAVADNFHHHFSVAEDGRIYGLTHQWRNTKERPVEGAPGLPELVLEDFLVVLSPEGKELSRVSLLDAMTAPGYRELFGSSIFRHYDANIWDRLHPNDVEVITPAFAARHPVAKPGMGLVSIRELDALILVDVESKSVTWATRGAWQRQHDPDLLPNGNVLLYDNRGADTKRGYARILELEPDSGRVVWSYTGSTKDSFVAPRWGGQQRLPNGNTMILTTNPGHVFEVTAAGALVWSYRDVQIYSALRVPKDWIQFVPTAPAPRRAAGGDDSAGASSKADAN